MITKRALIKVRALFLILFDRSTSYERPSQPSFGIEISFRPALSAMQGGRIHAERKRSRSHFKHRVPVPQQGSSNAVGGGKRRRFFSVDRDPFQRRNGKFHRCRCVGGNRDGIVPAIPFKTGFCCNRSICGLIGRLDRLHFFVRPGREENVCKARLGRIVSDARRRPRLRGKGDRPRQAGRRACPLWTDSPCTGS